ncbi:hypothetical protein NQ315_002582 [Exocentrus adspersus]|uniref:Reverse transcriptase n=1 Tax=Exocentrus adspersus TaxID=1586481 RepID=A0AAV8VUQ8_9CUCU|nr:hypothetical protein NQ315_002582 [Exocentrus adspersus]
MNGWKWGKLDADIFKRKLLENERFNEETHTMQTYMKELQDLCKGATPKIRTDGRGNAVYWWTPEIAQARNLSVQSRRTAQRARTSHRYSPPQVQQLEEVYKQHRKALRKLIWKSKNRCWKEMPDLTEQKRKTIASALFPQEPSRAEYRLQGSVRPEEDFITIEDVKEAVDRLKPRKAPGLDGVPSEAIKILAIERPQLTTAILNRCYGHNMFPDDWKTARLVLIPKPRKQGEDASSYRPLCLLDTMAKLYEGVLANKLNREIERTEHITPGKELKYLGVTIDRGMTFGRHVDGVCQKAGRTAAALMRLMPNIGGPGQMTRRVLAEVVNSVILYAAPIWADAVRIQKHRNRLLTSQRATSLRVAKAYRTTSTETVLVIADTIPIDLLIEERKRIYLLDGDRKEGARREREVTLRNWQEHWDSGTKGRWTHVLIPEVGRWLSRRDTAQHTIFECPRWERYRRTMEVSVNGGITPETLIRMATESEAAWKGIMDTINQVMTIKEQEFRQRGM